ncbi:MAG: AraC family transcriptional regulator [Lentisphaerae bacterium]|nr:MAG: AraC family transcriptional regulator [Lentisphaerota bacterium]
MSVVRFPNLEFRVEAGSLVWLARSCGPCHFTQEVPTNHLHSHQIYEMCLVHAGRGHFRHGKDEFQLARGDVFVANPHVAHEIDSYGFFDLSLVFFQFQYQLLPAEGRTSGMGGELAERSHRFIEHHAVVRHGPAVLFSLLNVLGEYERLGVPRQWLRDLVVDLFFQCLDTLSGIDEGGAGEVSSLRSSQPVMIAGHQEMLRRAVAYIQRHLSRTLYLSDIASHAGTSARNLQLLFQRYLGCSISDHIKTQRMRQAAGYLLMGYRVQEVAELLGYTSPASFARIFRQVYGESPKAYQQRLAPSLGTARFHGRA